MISRVSVEALAAALDADVSPHHAAQGAFDVGDVQLGLVRLARILVLEVLRELDRFVLRRARRIARRRGAEGQAFQQRIARQPIRAVQARAARFADRIRPGRLVRPSSSASTPPIM